MGGFAVTAADPILSRTTCGCENMPFLSAHWPTPISLHSIYLMYVHSPQKSKINFQELVPFSHVGSRDQIPIIRNFIMEFDYYEPSCQPNSL